MPTTGRIRPRTRGLSYIAVSEDGAQRVTLRDAVYWAKGDIIGENLWKKYGRWPVYSKFFDNLGPLPHHIHHRQEHAARVGQDGKPEMYFFPAQMNNHGGEFPFTFFGLNPGTTKEQVREALANFSKGDNNLLALSRAYKLNLDTGWDVPPACCTRREACAPMSRSLPQMFTPCTSRCSIMSTACRKNCFGRIARSRRSATLIIC